MASQVATKVRATVGRIWPYLFFLALGGCGSLPDTLPLSYFDVPSAYTQKVPGRWALVVANASLDTDIEAPGFACAGMNFPVKIDNAFRQYLVQGFGQIADEVTPVDHSLSDIEIRSGRFSGQIIVGSLALAPSVNFAQHGFTAFVDSSISISVSMDVAGHGRPLLHRTIAVTGISHVDAGIGCENAAGGLARAVDSAAQQISVSAASAFADSTDIRLVAEAR